jgi:hypothetical protein
MSSGCTCRTSRIPCQHSLSLLFIFIALRNPEGQKPRFLISNTYPSPKKSSAHFQ